MLQVLEGRSKTRSMLPKRKRRRKSSGLHYYDFRRNDFGREIAVKVVSFVIIFPEIIRVAYAGLPLKTFIVYTSLSKHRLHSSLRKLFVISLII